MTGESSSLPAEVEGDQGADDRPEEPGDRRVAGDVSGPTHRPKARAHEREKTRATRGAREEANHGTSKEAPDEIHEKRVDPIRP